MNQIFIELFVCVVGLLAIKGQAKPKCEMTEAYANECGKKLIFIGEHTTGLPSSDAEMLHHCKNIGEGLGCLKEYSKACLDPFATQMMKVIIKSGGRTEQKYCKEDKGRKELLGHFQCSEQTAEKFDLLHMCMDKFIVEMEHMSDVGGDHRIPAICCSFHVMDSCVRKALGTVCKKPDSVQYITNFLTELTGDIVKTGCGKFDSLAHCDANMDKAEWQILKDLVNSDDPATIAAKRQNESPFNALRNVMKQLMEE